MMIYIPIKTGFKNQPINIFDQEKMINRDDATFKRVRLQENGLTLQPLNSKYEPRFFNAKEIQDLPVRILGVVVEIRRNLRK